MTMGTRVELGYVNVFSRAICLVKVKRDQRKQRTRKNRNSKSSESSKIAKFFESVKRREFLNLQYIPFVLQGQVKGLFKFEKESRLNSCSDILDRVQ